MPEDLAERINSLVKDAEQRRILSSLNDAMCFYAENATTMFDSEQYSTAHYCVGAAFAYYNAICLLLDIDEPDEPES